MKVDVFDPGRLGEEFDDAWSVGCEPLIVAKCEQYVRWLASVGDVDGAVFGCGFGAAGVLVEFSAGELLCRHDISLDCSNVTTVKEGWQWRVLQGCRRASGLLMASSTLERHLAVGSGFRGRQMPLRDAGYRKTSLDAAGGRFVQVPPPTRFA